MRAKLTDEQVYEIRVRHHAGLTCSALAREVGVDPTTITAIVTGKARPHAGGPIRAARASRTDEQAAVAATCARAGTPLLSHDAARQIREAHAEGVAQAELGRVYGVSEGTIWYIVTGRTYRDAGGPVHNVRPRAKLTDRQVYEIRLWAADGASDAEIAEEFGVSLTLVGDIRRGKARPRAGGPTETRDRSEPVAIPVVWEIRRRLAAGERQRDIAAATGVCLSTVCGISTGRVHHDTPSEFLPAPGQ